MFPFVRAYDPQIRTRPASGYGDDYELYRDNKRFVPSVWLFFILVQIPLIWLGFEVHPGWFSGVAALVVFGIPIICTIMNDEDLDYGPYLLIRGEWKMKYHLNPNGNYYPKSIPKENIANPIYQEALNDMVKEAESLGDKFDINNWASQLDDLNAALNEQFELEKEALNKFNRTDYAALVKQTNAIMRDGMKNV